MAYATVAHVKSYLGLSGTGDDALISTLLSAATAAIEAHTQREFQAQVNETRDFSLYDVQNGTLYLDDDLCEINNITVEADNGSGGVTLATTDYITKPRNKTPYYAIKMISSSSNVWSYSQSPDTAIKVSGKWGWSQTPPNDIEHACVRLAGYYYRQKDAQVYDVTATPELGQITTPQGLPADVRIILAPYVKL